MIFRLSGFIYNITKPCLEMSKQGFLLAYAEIYHMAASSGKTLI